MEVRKGSHRRNRSARRGQLEARLWIRCLTRLEGIPSLGDCCLVLTIPASSSHIAFAQHHSAIVLNELTARIWTGQANRDPPVWQTPCRRIPLTHFPCSNPVNPTPFSRINIEIRYHQKSSTSSKSVRSGRAKKSNSKQIQGGGGEGVRSRCWMS